MKKYLILGLLAAMLVVSVGVVLAAKPDFQWTPVNPSGGGATVTIPAHAIEVAPGVFSLGIAIDNGKIVEGYAFIDYKKGFGKPTGCKDDGKCQGWEDPSCPDCVGGGNGGNGGDSKCYGFLARGARWRTIEPYIVNTSNTQGLSDAFIRSNLAGDIAKWETVAGVEILGLGNSTNEILVADTVSPDDKNEVYFGDINQPGAIAITIVWGIFYGPPSQRELVEWDQVYNQADFDWSADCKSDDCTTKMDFENIAIHELGHSVGLDDLYESKCSEQTMYGWANYGETKKRTLETGDTTGIQKLYQ